MLCLKEGGMSGILVESWALVLARPIILLNKYYHEFIASMVVPRGMAAPFHILGNFAWY